MRSSSHRAIGLVLGSVGILVLILWLRSGRAPTPTPNSVASASRESPADTAPEISGADTAESRVSIADGVASSSRGGSAPPSVTRTNGSFVGTILEEDGSPIPPELTAWVDLRDAVGRRWMQSPDQGRVQMGDLRLGSYTATVYAFRHRMVAEPIELTASAPDVVREFRLPRLPALSVSVVTPDGRPFRAARRESHAPKFLDEILPVATRGSPGARFEAMRGDGADPVGIGEFWDASASEYDASPATMGTLVLHAELPACVSLVLGQAVLQTKRVERGATQVTFVLSVEEVVAELPSLRVQVLDAATSMPIEGAIVRIGSDPIRAIEAHSNSAGEAALELLLPGRVPLLCNKEGYADSRQELDLPLGSAIESIVRLSQPMDVEVHVFLPDGSPCAASLGLSRLQKDTGRAERVADIHSNAHGNAALKSLDRGMYLIHDANGSLRDPSNLRGNRIEFVPANVVVDTTSGPPKPIEVRLSTPVTLWIRSPPGDPVDLEYEVTDSRDLPVCADRFDLPWPRCLHLAPGTYRVRFKDSSGKVLEEKKVVLADSPVEVTFGG